MKHLRFALLFIWQFPQIILGLLLSFVFKCSTTLDYKFTMVRVCPKFRGGLSLGPIIFVRRYPNNQETWNTVKHEFGHSLQSRYLGPLYLIIIGLPSLIWAAIHTAKMGSYYSFYTEKWADKLGNVTRK